MRRWGTNPPLAAQEKEAHTTLISRSRSRCVRETAQSPSIDVEIIVAAKDRNLRADVDYVAKPILDALKGNVHEMTSKSVVSA